MSRTLEKIKLGKVLEFSEVSQAKLQALIPANNNPSESVPYVVQSERHNMYSRNVDKKWLINHNEPPINGNCIVLGVTLPAISYQPSEFGASQVIIGRNSNMNEFSGLYLVSSIRKILPKFSYDNKPGINVYNNTTIKLPLNNGHVDWKYMENFIKKYELIYAANIKNQLIKKATNAKNNIAKINYKKFNLDDLFTFKPSKRKYNAVEVRIYKNQYKNTCPYVVRQATNNGIRGYIKGCEKYLNPANTISFAQDTSEFFYQPSNYFTSDKVQILYPNFKMNCINAQYILTAMHKAFIAFSWGTSSFNVNKLGAVKIKLPVNKDGSLNISFMESYINDLKNNILLKVINKLNHKILFCKNN